MLQKGSSLVAEYTVDKEAQKESKQQEEREKEQKAQLQQQQPQQQPQPPQPQPMMYPGQPQPLMHSASAPAVYGYQYPPGMYPPPQQYYDPNQPQMMMQPMMVQQQPGQPPVMMMVPVPMHPQMMQPTGQPQMTQPGPGGQPQMMMMPPQGQMMPPQGQPQMVMTPQGMMMIPPQHQAMMPPVPVMAAPVAAAPEDPAKTRRLYRMKHIPQKYLVLNFVTLPSSEISTIEDFKTHTPLYKVTHAPRSGHFFPIDVRDVKSNQCLYRITTKWGIHDKYILHQHATESASGRKVATIKKNFTWTSRLSFEIHMKAGKPIKLEGEVASYNFTFIDAGNEIAHISRDHKHGITNKINRTTDEYMVSAEPGTDDAFVLACAIIIDHIISKQKHHR